MIGAAATIIAALITQIPGLHLGAWFGGKPSLREQCTGRWLSREKEGDFVYHLRADGTSEAGLMKSKTWAVNGWRGQWWVKGGKLFVHCDEWRWGGHWRSHDQYHFEGDTILSLDKNQMTLESGHELERLPD